MLHPGWFIQRGRLLYKQASNRLLGRWCSTQGLGARAAQLSSQPAASCPVGVVGVLDQRRQGRVLCKARKVAARPVTNLCQQHLPVLRVLLLPGTPGATAAAAHLAARPRRRLLLPVNLKLGRPRLLRGRQAAADVDGAVGLDGQGESIWCGAGGRDGLDQLAGHAGKLKGSCEAYRKASE